MKLVRLITREEIYDKPIEALSITGEKIEIIGERDVWRADGRTAELYIYNIVGYTPKNGKPFAALKNNITLLD